MAMQVSPALLSPTVTDAGLRRPSNPFSLKSSFSPPCSLRLPDQRKKPVVYSSPRISMRVASKKAYVCSDCGEGLNWDNLLFPLFDGDGSLDAGTLSRKVTNFMMVGWWSGVPTLSYNQYVRDSTTFSYASFSLSETSSFSCLLTTTIRLFSSKVGEKCRKDAELIVACQKGFEVFSCL